MKRHSPEQMAEVKEMLKTMGVREVVDRTGLPFSTVKYHKYGPAKESAKAWKLRNPEKIRAYKQIWRDKNPQYGRSEASKISQNRAKAAWNKKHPEKQPEYERRYRAKKKQAEEERIAALRVEIEAKHPKLSPLLRPRKL